MELLKKIPRLFNGSIDPVKFSNLFLCLFISEDDAFLMKKLFTLAAYHFQRINLEKIQIALYDNIFLKLNGKFFPSKNFLPFEELLILYSRISLCKFLKYNFLILLYCFIQI